jgi:hypothetical protein
MRDICYIFTRDVFFTRPWLPCMVAKEYVLFHGYMSSKLDLFNILPFASSNIDYDFSTTKFLP